jgi:hypothetical protein
MHCGGIYVKFWHCSIATLVALVGLVFGGCIEPPDDEPIGDAHTGWIDRSALGELKVEPDSLEFGPTEIGAEALEQVEVTNVGIAPVEITRFELREDYDPQWGLDGLREFFEGEQGWSDSSVSLAPGESHTLSIRYLRRNATRDLGRIVLSTRNTIAGTFEVPIQASSAQPDIEAPRFLAFEGVPPQPDEPGWRGEHRLLTVHNVGQAVLRFDDIFVTGSDRFSLSFPRPDAEVDPSRDSEIAPEMLAPGQSASIRVWFQPDDYLPQHAELIFATNDPDQALFTVDLTAPSSPCPLQASASASVLEADDYQTTLETVPLNTVIFDASASGFVEGSNRQLEWTIVSRPPGSTQRLLPNSRDASPRLFLDVAGTYEVQLRVGDDSDQQRCEQRALVTINAVPDKDIHIQLVWDTPEDPDQTDRFGTDIDLHYLHPNGRWDEGPWDIYWRNPGENWGMQSSSDDPHIDIDDTDGAGPEHISHSGLENVNYRVGAYYYSDATLGSSNATVRIYVRGELEFEMAGRRMPRIGAFWKVALIHGRTLAVTPIDRMHEDFPEQN